MNELTCDEELVANELKRYFVLSLSASMYRILFKIWAVIKYYYFNFMYIIPVNVKVVLQFISSLKSGKLFGNVGIPVARKENNTALEHFVSILYCYFSREYLIFPFKLRYTYVYIFFLVKWLCLFCDVLNDSILC